MKNEMINENSRKETYERLQLEVTAFDSEDIITTSAIRNSELEADEYEYIQKMFN